MAYFFKDYVPHDDTQMDSNLPYNGILGELESANALPMRNRRGIVDECCLKSCSLATLQTYCG